MQPRSFLLLLAVTLLAVAGAVAATLTNPIAKVADSVSIPALPLLAERAGEVAAIEIESGAGGIRLELQTVEGAETGQWVLASKSGYPADPAAVKQLLVGLVALKLNDALTDDPKRFARLQLEELDAAGARSRRVRVLAADGDVLADLYVGRGVNRLVGESEGGTYLRLAGETQAWLAAGALALPADALGFADRRITTLPDDSVRRVAIAHPDGQVVLAERETPDQLLAVKTGLPEGAPADPAQLRRLAQLLEQLAFEDVAAEDAVAFPAAVVHTEVTSFDGVGVQLALAEIDGKYWRRVSASLAEEHSPLPDRKQAAESFAATLDAKAEGWVFQLSPAAWQRLTVPPAALTGQ